MIHMPSTTRAPGTGWAIQDEENNIEHRGYWIRDDLDFYYTACHCSTFQRKLWCKHTADAYFVDIPETAGARGIVVFAHKPWLICHTVVKPTESGSKWSTVTVMFGNITKVKSGYESDNAVEVGVINYKAGRGEIRRLILDWLPAIPSLYSHSMECEAAQHSHGDSWLERAKTNLADLAEVKKYLLAEAFTLLDTSTCMSCLEDFLIPVDPF